MKKFLSIFMMLLLVLSFSAGVTLAEETKPEDPIDPDDYVTMEVYSENSGTVTLKNGYSYLFSVKFEGYYTKTTAGSQTVLSYHITPTRTGYYTLNGNGTPYISNYYYYVSNSNIYCNLTISNGVSTGIVQQKLWTFES